jgi:hypothetical protein
MKTRRQTAKLRNDSTPTGKPTAEEIRQRAHEIFLVRGGAPGHELEDWLLAERELKQKYAAGRPPL